MSMKNLERWGGVSQTLHWLIALLILVLGIVGLTMGELPKTPKYFCVHRAQVGGADRPGLGDRAAWLAHLCRRTATGGRYAALAGAHRRVHPLAAVRHDLRHAAVGLVVRLHQRPAAVPLVRPVRCAQAQPPDEQLRAIAHFIHEWGFWLLIAVVLAHAGAAFYHHLFQRDATLARMLPRGWLAPKP